MNRESPGNHHKERIIRPKIIIGLLGLLLLMAVPAWSATLAPTTVSTVKSLEKFGYQYKGMRGNQAIFSSKQSVLTLSLNKHGEVYAAGISMGPQAKPEQVVAALYAIYMVLEVNKGRTQMLNQEKGLPKISRLLDKVKSAVKVSPKTQFRFEDMEVMATHNNKTDYYTIGLQPH